MAEVKYPRRMRAFAITGLGCCAMAAAFGCPLDVSLVDKHCNEQHPCIAGFTCLDAVCVPEATALDAGPGEGEGEGEGEGAAVGEGGEGEGGEGEGGEGEGEGGEGEGEGGEGEGGEGEGEGEGEGGAGEGEGEGALADGSCGAPFSLVLGVNGGDTAGAGADADGQCAAGSDDDVVWAFPSDHKQTLQLVLDSSLASSAAFDGVLYARTACVDPASELACADNETALNDERLDVDVAAGETAFVFVDGFGAGAYHLTASSLPSVCGDGRLNLRFEQCEDGNLVDTDICSASCVFNYDVDEVEPNDDGSPDIGGGCFTPNDIGAAGVAAARNFGEITSNLRVHGAIEPVGDEDAFPIRNNNPPGGADAVVTLTTHGRVAPCRLDNAAVVIDLSCRRCRMRRRISRELEP